MNKVGPQRRAHPGQCRTAREGQQGRRVDRQGHRAGGYEAPSRGRGGGAHTNSRQGTARRGASRVCVPADRMMRLREPGSTVPTVGVCPGHDSWPCTTAASARGATCTQQEGTHQAHEKDDAHPAHTFSPRGGRHTRHTLLSLGCQDPWHTFTHPRSELVVDRHVKCQGGRVQATVHGASSPSSTAGGSQRRLEQSPLGLHKSTRAQHAKHTQHTQRDARARSWKTDE